MTSPELTEPAGLALRSLADHPSRTTASGISNGPYIVGAYAPAEMHQGLAELEGRGLAVEKVGRWRLTDLGQQLAAPADAVAEGAK